MKNNLGLLQLIMLVPVRVRTSDGDATMIFPQLAEDGSVKLTELENDLPSKWVQVPPGSVVTRLSGVEKTDTWCAALQVPDGSGGFKAPIGLVLRRKSWQNLVLGGEASQVAEITPVAVAPAPAEVAPAPQEASEELPEAVPGDLSEDISVDEEQPAPAEVIAEDAAEVAEIFQQGDDNLVSFDILGEEQEEASELNIDDLLSE